MDTQVDQPTKFLTQRRFILCMVVVLGAIGLRAAGLLLDSSFTQVVIWVSGIFVAGDVGGTWVNTLAQRPVIQQNKV